MRVNVISKTVRRVRGFTLIELMVSITLGLIVTGALVAFTVSTVQSNSDNVKMTRLTQDLRTSMNVALREVRRAGYDSISVTKALTTSDPSKYLQLKADEGKSCVTYTYDRGNSTTESRGFKLNPNTGALQMKVASSVVDCDSATGWENVSDTNVVQMTKFVPRLSETRFCAELGEYKDPADATKTLAIIARGSVRTLAVCVKGNLRSDQALSRHVSDIVRLRAERLNFFTKEPAGTKCTAAEKAADAAILIDDWNKECAG